MGLYVQKPTEQCGSEIVTLNSLFQSQFLSIDKFTCKISSKRSKSGSIEYINESKGWAI